jgi:hypothetical protein
MRLILFLLRTQLCRCFSESWRQLHASCRILSAVDAQAFNAKLSSFDMRCP